MTVVRRVGPALARCAGWARRCIEHAAMVEGIAHRYVRRDGAGFGAVPPGEVVGTGTVDGLRCQERAGDCLRCCTSRHSQELRCYRFAVLALAEGTGVPA